MRTDWSNDVTLAAYDDGYTEGIQAAAEELLALMGLEGAIRGDGWRGPETISAVGQFFARHGIDVPEDDG